MAQRLKVELAEISDDDLLRLAPLYDADFQAFLPPGSGPMRLDLYLNEEHERYAIRADGELAGFAIASQGDAFRDPDETVWWVDEFFVMESFRRRGVGARAAMLLFDRHPGTWEVGQLVRNTPAQAFWRTVIGRYTNGSFEEIAMDDARWAGPVQYFTA